MMTTALNSHALTGDDKTAVSQPPMEKCVVANRTDGLGARLKAVVNGVWMASVLGVPFRLEWRGRSKQMNAFHAVVPATKMFSADFLKRYEVPGKLNVRNLVPITQRNVSVAELKARLMMPDCEGLLAGNGDYELSGDVELNDGIASRARAFSMVDFHPSVVSYIDQARSVPLPPKPAAIHLRAGDIVYGAHREKGVFTDKVISLPTAKRIIETLQADGYSVIVYGQDHEVLQYLKHTYVLTLGNEIMLPGQHESHQEAIFEMTTMSRCEKIVAGDSNFAILACWMAGQKRNGPEDFFSDLAQAEVILDDLSRNANVYPPLQTAFAYWSAFFWGEKDLDAAVLDFALDQAELYDPENGLYRITRVKRAVQQRDYVLAEALIQKAFNSESYDRDLWDIPLIRSLLLTDLKSKKRKYFEPYFSHVHKMGELGLPYGAACSAVIRAKKGDEDLAQLALSRASEVGLPSEWHPKFEQALRHFRTISPS